MWSKAWQNKRPGWTRRIRWTNYPDRTIGLNMCERMADNTNREVWKVRVALSEAEQIWDEYINNDTTGREIFLRVMEEQEIEDER